VPHVLQVVEADFSRVDVARRAAGEQWKQREGFALTYLSFIACAVAAALVKFPRLNASFAGDHLVLHRRVNLGVAVDLNFEGLMVPVLKDAAGMTLPRVARAVHDLASRARAGKLRPDDMTECTYTISNNGAFGTLLTAAIITPPQVAVLSTDAVRKRAVVIEGGQGDTVAVRPVGMLAQSFDHRAVDGAYSAAFLNEVKTMLETRDWQRELQG
jgi:2-oxoglutarate dehydrogenase E2 component (dihydrolipoamide succinyltransferase)